MNAMIMGIIRHLLTGVGGALVAKGVVDEGTASELVGALATLIGVAWSIWQKWKDKKTNEPHPPMVDGPAAARMLLVAGAFGLLMFGSTGCQVATKKHGNVVAVTQTVIGFQLSAADPVNDTPQLKFGYVRSQFHVVPTSTNQIHTPDVYNTIATANSKTNGQSLNEDFATGRATRWINQVPADETPAK